MPDLNPWEANQEAARIIREDRVPSDVVFNLIASFGDRQEGDLTHMSVGEAIDHLQVLREGGCTGYLEHGEQTVFIAHDGDTCPVHESESEQPAMTFLDDATVLSMGVVLGQHFTTGQLNELADLLGHAREACEYAADDLHERAAFERAHSGSEADDFEERARGFTDTMHKVGNLVAMIQSGEERGREDHQG